jgi:3-hydroxyisobutyrate dehydrogenase-like beta-hydroxyacid dehydrogenase
MTSETIGLLHPGSMGAGIGDVLHRVGHEVLWLPEGRSPETAKRAERAGLVAVDDLRQLVERSGAIVSVCPPSAAVELALQVAAAGGLDGRVFVDANAISPETARRVAAIVEGSGASYVDGGIVGNPPGTSGETRLYLSGPEAAKVVELFGNPNRPELTVIALGPEPAAASALKMTYGAWTKGTSALILAIRAVARREGVEAQLIDEWRLSQPALEGLSEWSAGLAMTKGWRWVGEMDEIAATFEGSGLPDGFHRAAAEIYRRSPRRTPTGDKDLDVDQVMSDLLASQTL